MIKLFVADVDGTLVNEYSEFEPETIEAIRRFRKLGGTFMVATGRNPWELSEITCEVEDVVLNCVNGAVLVQNGKTIFSEYLGADQVRLAQKLCDKYDTPVEFHGEQGTYTCWDKKRFYQRAYPVFQRSFREDPKDVFAWIYEKEEMYFNKTLEQIPIDCIAKIEVLFMKEDIKDELICEVKEAFFDANIVALDMMANIEITSACANKAKAISRYCEVMGIDEDEVVTIGDSGNDIPMLQHFKNSYAMGNADEATKKTAAHIALSNREKGVARLLESICDQMA